MENSKLQEVIHLQGQLNIVFRAAADNLFEIVKSLAGDTPREIYNFDKAKIEKLPHINSLEENNHTYENILEDIKISIHYLEVLIK